MNRIYLIFITLLLFNYTLIAQEKMDKKNLKTDAEWKQILSPEQYHILREKGTDRPGNSGYTNHFEKGTYFCAACNSQLFESNSKYESHCGWPSFDDAIKGAIDFKKDISHGMIRTEITCSNCEGI